MSDAQAVHGRSHTALRIIIVAFFVLLLAITYFPDLTRLLGYPLGDWGMTTDGLTVDHVAAGGPADRAGLHAGQSISLDLATNSALIQAAAVSDLAPWPGDAMAVKTLGPGKPRIVTLRAVPEPTTDYPYIVLRQFYWLIPLVIGGLLLLLRPSLTTWAFFLYSMGALGFNGAPSAVLYFRIIPPDAWVQNLYTAVLILALVVLPSFGIILFSFTLSHQPLNRWRRLALVLAAALALSSGAGFLWLSLDPVMTAPLNAPLAATSIGVSLLALIGLLDAYLYASERFKQRLQWIALGLVLSTAVIVTNTMLWPWFESYAFHALFEALLLVFPLVTAYALLRERVVDITFAISRTVVYGVLTASIVAIFALVDLFLSHGIAQGRLSLPVDIVLALVLGFWLNGAHKKIDLIVDRFLFRQRHRAEMQLARAANAVQHVTDTETIADFLVQLPVEVLDLSGAALYRRGKDGFVLSGCVGWEAEASASIAHNDPLAVYMSAELEPIRYHDIPLHESSPNPGEAPVLVMPLVLRHQLDGFVLYGAHRNSADLDPDEIAALRPLVTNAVVTFDHLESLALREKVRRYESTQAFVGTN